MLGSDVVTSVYGFGNTWARGIAAALGLLV